MPRDRTFSLLQPFVVSRRVVERDVELERDLVDDAFDVEEVVVAVQDGGGAVALAHSVTVAVVRAADLEECTVTRAVRTVERDTLQQAGNHREPHRSDVLRERIRDRDLRLGREERVEVGGEERVVDRFRHPAADQDAADVVFRFF